jgi:outer membrane protein TolC
VIEPGEPPDLQFVADAIDEMIDMALRSRPDIANKYAAYKSARALARQAQSNIYPTLNATLNGATTGADKTVRKDDPGAFSDTNTFGRSDSLSALFEVNIPVFDGFTLISKARAARKTAEAARADLANSELAAIADVATTFWAYDWAVKQYASAERLEEKSCEAYYKTEGEYQKALDDYQSEVQKTDSSSDKLDKLRKELVGKLNSYQKAQPDYDSARAQLSKSKLGVFTTSFQLANATGILIPAVARHQEPSVRSLPLPHKLTSK